MRAISSPATGSSGVFPLKFLGQFRANPLVLRVFEQVAKFGPDFLGETCAKVLVLFDVLPLNKGSIPPIPPDVRPLCINLRLFERGAIEFQPVAFILHRDRGENPNRVSLSSSRL